MTYRIRWWPWIVGVAAVVLFEAVPASAEVRPADQEPPVLLSVMVAGREYVVDSGEEFVAKTEGGPIKVRASVLAIRIFDNVNGITFPYPTDFTFKYTKGALERWRLSGYGCRIELRRYAPGGAAQALSRAEALNRKHRPKAEIKTGVPIVLGGKTLEGIHLEELGSERGTRERIVAFEGPFGAYTLFIRQMLDGKGRVGPVAKEALRLLTEKFHFPTESTHFAEREPPAQLSLKVGERSKLVAAGEEVIVERAGRPIEVTANVSSERLFDNVDGIRFRYPKKSSFKYRKYTEDMESWTVSATAGGCVFVLMKLAKSETPKEYVSSRLERMRKSYPKAQVKPQSPVRLGGKTVPGFQLVDPGPADPRLTDFLMFEGPRGMYTITMSRSLDPQGRVKETAKQVVLLLDQEFSFPTK